MEIIASDPPSAAVHLLEAKLGGASSPLDARFFGEGDGGFGSPLGPQFRNFLRASRLHYLNFGKVEAADPSAAGKPRLDFRAAVGQPFGWRFLGEPADGYAPEVIIRGEPTSGGHPGSLRYEWYCSGLTPAYEPLARLLQRLEADASPFASDDPPEARLISIPPTGIEAIWLARGAEDWIRPVPPPDYPTTRFIAAPEFCRIVFAELQKRATDPSVWSLG